MDLRDRGSRGMRKLVQVRMVCTTDHTISQGIGLNNIDVVKTPHHRFRDLMNFWLRWALLPQTKL